jgi:hypothetical protein
VNGAVGRNGPSWRSALGFTGTMLSKLYEVAGVRPADVNDMLENSGVCVDRPGCHAGERLISIA